MRLTDDEIRQKAEELGYKDIKSIQADGPNVLVTLSTTDNMTKVLIFDAETGKITPDPFKPTQPIRSEPIPLV